MPDHDVLVHIARREASETYSEMKVLAWIIAIGAFLILALLAYMDVKLIWVVAAGFGISVLGIGLLVAQAVHFLSVRLSYIEQASTQTLNHAERIDDSC